MPEKTRKPVKATPTGEPNPTPVLAESIPEIDFRSGQADMLAQEALERLATGAADLGFRVGELRTRLEIPLHSDSDRDAARESVAKAVLRLLGDVALSDEIDISLNGTSLSPELTDQACAAAVVYEV